MVTLTAQGVGLAAAIVSAVCCSASGTVAVAVIRTPTAITLSRTDLTLEAGDTAHLTASVVDGGGVEIADLVIDWTSSNPAVATVTSEAGSRAVVSAAAAGIAVVTARVAGLGAEARVAVAASDAPPVPMANECGAPRAGWVWCDDFEVDRVRSYFEYADAGGSFVRAASVGVGGSIGMRARFAAGQVDAGALHLALGRTPQSYFRPADDGARDHRELYWRIFVRNQPGWTGGGGDKLSRAFIFASPTTWAQAMIAHVWSGSGAASNYLMIDPASGTDESGNLRTTRYNDSGNLRWLGSRHSTTPVFDSGHVGQWQCVEARVRLNDPAASNGVFQLWINGSLEAERTDLNWIGAFNEYGLNAVYIENYWNDGSPVAQERYLDNFVVSTEPIGCGAG
ncbi:MAG: hypothetical protein RQ751_12450 [Longimicrobiales bacterium]|nr:hypothetical protein [Longimicrobiales bacterium]